MFNLKYRGSHDTTTNYKVWSTTGGLAVLLSQFPNPLSSAAGNPSDLMTIHLNQNSLVTNQNRPVNQHFHKTCLSTRFVPLFALSAPISCCVTSHLKNEVLSERKPPTIMSVWLVRQCSVRFPTHFHVTQQIFLGKAFREGKIYPTLIPTYKILVQNT